MFSFRCRAIVAIWGEGEAVEKQTHTHTHQKLAWNFNLYATNKWLSFSGGGGLKRESHGNIYWLCYFNLLPICLPIAWLIFSQCERTCIFPLISFCQMMKMVIFLLQLCFFVFLGKRIICQGVILLKKKTSTTASYAYSIGIYLHDFWFSNEPGGDDDDDYGDDDNFLADSNW